MTDEQVINLKNIPNTWGIATLTDMALKEKNAIKRGPFGSAIKKSFFVPKGYKIYEQKNVIYNDFKRGKYFISDDKYKELESFKVDCGDVLMSCSGTVGRLAVVPNEHEKGIINQALLKISLVNQVIDTKFFLYLFGFNINRILSQNTRGSAMLNISSVRDLKKIQFPLPSPPEQHRIVSKIDELFTRLDAGIEALNQVQTLLKRYRQSVLKSAVEGKLTSKWREQHKNELEPADKLLERILKERKEKWEAEQIANFKAKGKIPPKNWQNKYKEPTPPDTSKLPELPEGWVWCKLAQVTELITKGSSPRWQGFDYVDKGIMFIRSQNVGWGELTISDVAHLSKDFNKKQKKSILKSGDVLLNIVGASIGRAAIATEETENANINQAVALIRLFKNALSNTFLMNYLISAHAQSAIHSKAVDVARANFSLTDISELIVPLPPKKEQAKISAEIDRLSTIIEKTEHLVLDELKRSQSLRQSILKRAFEGRLVPQDPNDEPASVLLKKIKAEKANPKKAKQMEMF
jgi:type I restriction enzyme S subunit